MKRIFVISLLLITIVPCLDAQKKELSQARTYIKSGKNLDKAEQLMRNLLKDSANRQNEKVHLVLCEALRKQYEAGNEKLYLKQKYDTAALFNLARNMFLAYQALDSVEARPRDNGKVKIKYRDRNAAYLNGYRQNLFGGGAYYVRKNQYQKAYEMMDCYIDCQRQPLFSAYHYPDSPVAAYWTLFCGYKLKNVEMTLKYADTALKDTLHLEYTLQYLAETYKTMQEQEKYEATLRQGFFRYMDSPYFFTYLMDYYTANNRQDSAMVIADTALEKNDSSEIFLFAKSKLLLNIGKYEPCIALCNTLIKINPEFADAYYNAGVAYVNLAFELDKEGKTDAKKRKRIKAYYQKALPYIEKYRELQPDEKDKWAAALYNIYLELNMGKQFQEIDRLLR